MEDLWSHDNPVTTEDSLDCCCVALDAGTLNALRYSLLKVLL